MNIFKTIFGNKRSRVWAIVTVALVVLLVVVDVLAMHFSNIISIFLGLSLIHISEPTRP